MKEKQKISLNQDLSYIDTLDDLESKIKQTQAALRVDGNLLLRDLKLVPVETVKATFGRVTPFFAKTTRAEKTWNIIQTIVSLMIRNPEKENFKGVFDKRNLQSTLKQLGIFVGMNLVQSFIAKRQAKQNKK